MDLQPHEIVALMKLELKMSEPNPDKLASLVEALKAAKPRTKPAMVTKEVA